MLSKEFKYESENVPTIPPIVDELLKKGVWKISENPGMKEIILSRNFENENIKVFFSTDSIMESEEDDASEVEMTAIISKDSAPGALEFQITASASEIYVEHVGYFKDSKIALDATCEGDARRQDVYDGPVFNELDEDLQENFQTYLEERGFDEALAEFVPAYIDYKEQLEYMNWLKNVDSFVSK